MKARAPNVDALEGGKRLEQRKSLELIIRVENHIIVILSIMLRSGYAADANIADTDGRRRRVGEWGDLLSTRPTP